MRDALEVGWPPQMESRFDQLACGRRRARFPMRVRNAECARLALSHDHLHDHWIRQLNH